ncbi:MAG: hemolysin III family protein [Bacteroidales bacterium]|nr:hemolysin III family protein [Bacteroidales bacterium]
MENIKLYSEREEKANYLTHALGVLMAIVGTYILVYKASDAGNSWAIIAHSVFGFGMFICMLSSTIYHYVQEAKTKKVLRHFDHASIYLLIAASYSPFSLILLRQEGMWGWSLFILVWLIALVGIGFNFRPIKKNSHLKTASYVLMGMTALIAIKPTIRVAIENDCVTALYWLAAGGVFYIIGAVIYALAKKEFVHTVFHVFVLLGLGSHIISAYLIPV